MAECIDIFRSIGASCNALNNVGGVNKRVWITQLSQVLNYTFDSDGYLNTIELTSGNTLKTITGKKFSNSGTFEGVIGNAKLIKQNAILKIFYSNPTDKSSIETYIKAQQLVVFFETESKKIEVYGLEKGMTLSAFVGGTGTNLQDESSILYSISGEQKSLPFYFRNGTFYESVEYLNNLSSHFPIQSITIGTPTVDCQGALLTIPFTTEGLPEGDTFNLEIFDNGAWVDADGSTTGDVSQIPIDDPFILPISNTGSGISNGTYTLRFVSNATGAVSDGVTFEINCPIAPFEKTLVLNNVSYTPLDSPAGFPVDLAIDFTQFAGFDGTNPIDWDGTETFQLQLEDGTPIGSPISVASPNISNVQLENGTYKFKLACIENGIESNLTGDVNVNASHTPAQLYFSLNVPSSDVSEPDGMTFKVTVDAVEYSVTGTIINNAYYLHGAMRDLLSANAQGFTLDNWAENGGPTNYAYTLKAPAQSNATWNGKVVRVEVSDPLNIGYGNITIGATTSGNNGTDPLEGAFSGGY